MPPFGSLPFSAQFLGLLLAGAASVALGKFLSRASNGLKPTLPRGILSLEAPWTSARAKCLRDALGSEGRDRARRQIYWDFLFLVLYSIAFSLASGMLAERLPGECHALGIQLSWLCLLAGGLDAIENVCMLVMLNGPTTPPWPQLASVACTLKFAILGVAVAFLVVGVIAVVTRPLLARSGTLATVSV